MSEWTPVCNECESDLTFEELSAEVQKYVQEARNWGKGERAWCSLQFVDRPQGHLFEVRRSVDETGMEEIQVSEIRYVEQRMTK